MSVEYDKSSIQSIYEHATELVGKSLHESTNLPESVVNVRNRGDLGRLIEVHFFKHTPPNNHEPDFAEVGLELKTTGIEKYKKTPKSGATYRAKERLVLSTINFQTLSSEEWSSSTLLKKCNLMLILFYEYQGDIPVIEQQFVLKPLLLTWSLDDISVRGKNLDYLRGNAFLIPREDILQIRRDWEFIRNKVASNKAHELSEGDTFYLGACRKGSGGANETQKKQLGTETRALGRAFSLKQSYVTRLLQHHDSRASLGISLNLTFEEATAAKFDAFLGYPVEDLCARFQVSSSAKQVKHLLAKKILSTDASEVTELAKAGITMKTVSFNRNRRVREDISFPAFKYLEVAKQEWDESDFADQIEGKFLFVLFQQDENGVDRLVGIKYWNMPYEDRLEAKRVWELAKANILIDSRGLPGKKQSLVSHVRPHGKNKRDLDLTPQGEYLQKKCFWLNSRYIKSQIEINPADIE